MGKGPRPYPVSITETTKLLGVSRDTIYRYIKKMKGDKVIKRIPSGKLVLPKEIPESKFHRFNSFNPIKSDKLVSDWIDDLLTRKGGEAVVSWRARVSAVESVCNTCNILPKNLIVSEKNTETILRQYIKMYRQGNAIMEMHFAKNSDDIKSVTYRRVQGIRDFCRFHGMSWPRGTNGIMSQKIPNHAKYSDIRLTNEELEMADDYIKKTWGLDSDIYRWFWIGIESCARFNALYNMNLDFTKNPRVAIVPSPDDINEAKRYIVPAQEGIQMWKTYLSNKYGGNWNVDFEVITPDKLFFENKPDIIMNLVTPEQEFGCNYDYYGISYPSTTKPVQTSVCISFNGQKRDSAGVSATAAHEFIHAVGLGHAWNKDRDLMCSVEDGKETCKTQNKVKTPSDLNLVGVVNLYNVDGFKNPNNKVTTGTKISLDSNAEKKTTSKTATTSQIDTDKDKIPDSKDKCKTKPETYNGYRDLDGCPDKKPQN
jgi:hypothetical protein